MASLARWQVLLGVAVTSMAHDGPLDTGLEA